jgi:ribonucleoside-diphosphate reductase alpha chain
MAIKIIKRTGMFYKVQSKPVEIKTPRGLLGFLLENVHAKVERVPHINFELVDSSLFIDKIFKHFDGKEVDDKIVYKKSAEIISETISAMTPEHNYLAGDLYLSYLRRQALDNREEAGGDRYISSLIKLGVEERIYASDALTLLEGEYTSKKGLTYPKVDKVYNSNRLIEMTAISYAGARILENKYLGKVDGKVFETPEERMFMISSFLMMYDYTMKKPKMGERISVKPNHEGFFPLAYTPIFGLIKEMYMALVTTKIVLATPTFANAGRTSGQMSSCFIDTMDDDLTSIYHSVTSSAELSKAGGGIAVYLGKLRSVGASIGLQKGVGTGVITWMRQLNEVANGVNQGGIRKGAIAVYLDVHHLDIVEFIEAKSENGDQRRKTHDLFLGICVPDIFMSKVAARQEWYMFDPKEVKDLLGRGLEDFYDASKTQEGEPIDPVRHAYSWHYEKLVRMADDGLIRYKKMPALDLMKLVIGEQKRTGTPYMFYRDTVNRKNTMKDGIIYSSNLCTEIMQNMTPTQAQGFVMNEDGTFTKHFTAGDYVVCNLSSLNLPAIYYQPEYNRAKLERTIQLQIRALDNVIELNEFPVPEAKITNKKYRPIGAGSMGKHTLLSLEGKEFDSKTARRFMNKLYDDIAYFSIKASMELAKERGSFPAFYESKWSDGTWFDEHGLTSKRWTQLKKDVMRYGMRNAYVMAVAPNATISHIASVSPSHDPAFQRAFVLDKDGIKCMATGGGFVSQSYWFFKNASDYDQLKMIKQTAGVQRFVDQAISFNFYVKKSVKMSELYELHMSAWKHGLKSTYYVRSKDDTVDDLDCESCT